jgi:hypothetical protein
MIDMSVVLNNPDLCQAFTAQRSSGFFVAGRFVSTSTDVPLYGSVQVADPKTLEQVPEADRVTGAIAVYTTSPLYETSTGDNEGLSDILLHGGQQYRVAKIWNWLSSGGFVKAYAVRIKGS